MDENILKFRVGIFVVIAMCILGILIFLNSEGWVPQYTLYINPVSAPGVTQGTPIRKNGILIGRVKSVSTEDGYVRLELGINQDEKIYENEICSIGSESLLGDAVIEVLPLAAGERGALVTNQHVMGKVAIKRDPLKMFADLQPDLAETLKVIQGAGTAIEEAGTGVRTLTDSVQNAFRDDGSDFKQLIADVRQMSQKAQGALDNFNRIFENINNVVGDPELKGQIKSSLAELPKIFREIRVTIADTRETVKSFGEIPDAVTGTLENVEAFSESLKEQGPEVLTQINTSLRNVDDLVSQVKGFAGSLSKLQDSNGTLSKLINDSELYDRVLQTIGTIQKEVVKIEPAMNDIRLFTDAIARDPGVLGVRGALDRRPGKTGAKGTSGRDGGLFRR